MERILELWPLMAGALVAIGPSLWSFLTKFFDPSRRDQLSQQGWTRAGSLETEIKSLRILLDRCRRRESAKDAVIEILLLALELGDDLTEEAARAFIARAKETLKRSIEDGSKQ
jgi:hypothetical protein